jgi:hypothetical protein
VSIVRGKRERQASDGDEERGFREAAEGCEDRNDRHRSAIPVHRSYCKAQRG